MRYKEETEIRELENIDIERRRNMTDLEILAENEEKNGPMAEKETLGFLQRYYHKGAFFRGDEEAEVLKRDTNAPTLEDKSNKVLLPEVMQVKKFGLQGR